MGNLMREIKNIFSDRQFTRTLLFVIFLYVFEEFIFDHPQRTLFQTLIIFRPPNEILVGMLSGIASFLYFFCFVWFALESSRAFRFVYGFLFAVAVYFQYGFGRGLGRFIATVDVQIVAVTPLNVWLDAAAIYMDWYFLIPFTAFLFLLFIQPQTATWKKSIVSFSWLFLFTIFLGFSPVFIDSTLALGTSLSSYFQTVSQYVVEAALPSKREQVTLMTEIDPPQNNIILIIDESIRGDHLSINGYERETTPFLDQLAQQDDYFHNWGLSVSGATCSYLSNALILTGVRPGADEFKDSSTYPTIFQYAKARGYTTYYLDAQTNSLWNGLESRDMEFIDDWYKAADLGDDNQSDFRAADIIAQIASNGTGSLIVLNKRGVHFLYESSYPPEAEVWTPVPGSYDEQPKLVVNPYDNGLRYNVNTFFERLNPTQLENTVILYTSDHGQTLFESNANWLHCNHTPQEATVPLLVMGRGLPTPNTELLASHSNILPTILDMMNVPEEQRAHAYALSLFSESTNLAVDRFFFNGSLNLVDFPD